MTPSHFIRAQCALLAIGLLAGCGQQIEATTNSPDLKVSVSSCKESKLAANQPPIQKLRWTGPMTMEVTARGEMSCGVDRVMAGYGISGKTLELGYAGSAAPGTAKASSPDCRCVHEFTYVISNIDKRGYVVNLDNISRSGNLKKWQDRGLKIKYRDEDPPTKL